jgi:hypothetical protein
MFGQINHLAGTPFPHPRDYTFSSLAWAVGNTHAKSIAGLLSCSVVGIPLFGHPRG